MKTVLLVEDTTTQAMLIQHLLASEGFDVSIAMDGEQALRLLRETGDPPDLILTDWNMPRLDGPGLCRILKADAKFCAIPIVLMTRFSEGQGITDILECGADDFIWKHLWKSYFVQRLNDVFNKLPHRHSRGHDKIGAFTISGVRHDVPIEPVKTLAMLASAFATAAWMSRRIDEERIDDDEESSI